MAEIPTMEQMTKEVAEKAMQNITINALALSEFVENLNNAVNNNSCHLASCRYNCNGICQNEDKRKECVDLSKLVLCLEDKGDERE